MWDKDGLPIIYVTPEEHFLIHCMEEERNVLNKGHVLLGRQNGKFSLPASYKLILLYKKYKRHFHFIKARKLKKNLKVYGINLK